MVLLERQLLANNLILQNMNFHEEGEGGILGNLRKSWREWKWKKKMTDFFYLLKFNQFYFIVFFLLFFNGFMI